MKIGSQQRVELLQRMQQAHESGRATGSAAPTAKPAAPASPHGDAASAPTRSELEQRLATTAAAALEGAFDSDEALRAAVIEVIVEERYGAGLTSERRDAMIATLTEALVDDPSFKRQVDEMLILAASELGGR